MGKGLINLILLGTFAFIAKAGAQSGPDNVPKQVIDKATNYLSYAAGGCGTIPEVSLVGEKIEPRANRAGFKDEYPDKVLLYQIDNACDWPNVPTHFVCIYAGKKEGGFEEVGQFVEDTYCSRDAKNNPVKPKDW